MEFTYFSISRSGLFNRKYHVLRNNEPYALIEKESFWKNNYIMFDARDRELLYLKKKFAFFTYIFHLLKGHSQVGEIKKVGMGKKFHLKTREYDLEIQANFFGSQFAIYDGETEISKGTWKAFTSKEFVTFAVMEGYEDEYVVSLIMVMILVMKMQRQKSS